MSGLNLVQLNDILYYIGTTSIPAIKSSKVIEISYNKTQSTTKGTDENTYFILANDINNNINASLIGRKYFYSIGDLLSYLENKFDE